jgi:hypothetical protein
LEDLLVAYKNCESEISKEKPFNAYIDKAIECLHKCAKIAEEEVLDSKYTLTGRKSGTPLLFKNLSSRYVVALFQSVL